MCLWYINLKIEYKRSGRCRELIIQGNQIELMMKHSTFILNVLEF